MASTLRACRRCVGAWEPPSDARTWSSVAVISGSDGLTGGEGIGVEDAIDLADHDQPFGTEAAGQVGKDLLGGDDRAP